MKTVCSNRDALWNQIMDRIIVIKSIREASEDAHPPNSDIPTYWSGSVNVILKKKSAL